MKFLAFAAVMFFAHFAAADDFSARVAAGRAAAMNGEGSKYDISVWPILTEAGSACDPRGMTVPADELGQFALVGGITGAGRLVAIEVRPDNKMSECFAAQLAAAQFAPPPLEGRATYPIVVALTVTP